MSPHFSVVIGSDHAGFDLKEYLKHHLPEYTWVDQGSTTSVPVDYPDIAAQVGQLVGSGQFERGILVCGSGIGMAIAANKILGVRAAAVESERTARLSRAHNNANILALGSRILAREYATEIVKLWLQSPFDGGRHTVRLTKISNLEKHS